LSTVARSAKVDPLRQYRELLYPSFSCSDCTERLKICR